MTDKSAGGASVPNALTVAIAQLEDIERQLVTQLEATRIAIGAMRNITDGTWPNVELGTATSTERPTPAAPAKVRKSRAAPGDEGFIAQLRVALKDGPLSPRELADKLDLSLLQLRHRLPAMRGIVKVTGKTAGRRIELKPERASKEVP